MSKRVVITGGTRGIGNGLAREFLKRECQVTITGRSESSVAAAVTELGGYYGEGRVAGSVCHVTDSSQLQGVWDVASEKFGGVDVWINNAGMSIERKPLWKQSDEAIEAVVGTNITGALLASKVAITNMLDQGHGQLWNTEGFGSDGATQAGMAAYGSTKRAVRYMQKALRKDTADTPVQICTLSPGIVVTDLLVGDYDLTSEQWEKAKKIFNILGDDVHTVTPWLADQVLAADTSGARIAWLTRRKASRRFMTAAFNKRDLFAEVDGA
ncbi:MAG: SDR family NAD(P)-dependent oxidoreductase [Actinomycetota bacterium]|jgi:NAD(P)-dependent dehydrogenase (short-subunit alcohol dehydrogenase family)|nr:SDR family NAD(P)-dependent oxidoreductase [Actinomycetota bacterium]